MKKWMKATFATASSLLLLAACGQASGENQDASNETLVIYSNSVSNGRGEWLKEKASEAGYNIEMVEVPGGELAERLVAEKNNAVADLVFGPNALDFQKLEKEEILLEYTPTWADEVDRDLGKDGLYYPVSIQPLVLIGNQEVDMPSDWTDLASSQYQERYSIFPLSGGTSRTILASIVSRYPDKNGELGVSEEGWEIAKEYIQHSLTTDGSSDYIGALIDNQVGYQMMWGSGVLQNEAERNYTFQVMLPKVGVPFVAEQIGIVASSAKTDLAQEFIDWFGSAEIQEQWSATFGTIPANQKALESASDEVKTFMDSVVAQELDWEFIGQYIDEWVEKAELEFVQ